ncbi:MAG: carbamoyltransferase HypF [Zoogloeaceae bacterium]|nr:carbamoyltransferase HypF [Zoogloeaceae bacterium]
MDERLRHVERRYIRVRGVVQGVGFRPFVFRLAREMGLAGWVRNDGGGVEIEIQGSPGDISALMARMVGEAPPLARVDAVESRRCAADPEDTGFTIVASGGGAITTAVSHDVAVCGACLAEMFDPTNRRWRYAFTNCTQCGPRYSITRSLPYDRVNTSMASFPLCKDCRDEYHDGNNRRFHAEPNACPACGPRLSLLEAYGVRVVTRDPLADAMARILSGEIVAVKGLGGFHLICDGRNPVAVERLRSRKEREEKPLAVMVANVASAQAWGRLSAADAALLESPERPIVLVPKTDAVEFELCGVADGMPRVGLMLPYTPLHYLLFHEAAGRPGGTAWLDQAQSAALVCTSANPSGEPIVVGNPEALRRLTGIADAFLVHDRDIVQRCDDSIVRSVPGPFGLGDQVQFIRRSRGYTPRAIRLARKGPSVMAFGSWLKNTLCLTRGDEAFLSQHVGDLETATTCLMMDDVAEHLMQIIGVQPELVACDLHPEFHSSQAAAGLAEHLGVPLVGVQHHHAHVAAVAAEHRWTGPVLGLALDGVGVGIDGAAWGGELLRVEGGGFERLAHLRPLSLPGGDRAAREPWRMAAAALYLLGEGAEIARRFDRLPSAHQLNDLLKRGTNCPPTTSMGRWFDAAAALLGVCRTATFEGQAAMLLEGLAAKYGPALPAPVGWRFDAEQNLDLLPLLAALIDERNPARGAAVFHVTLAAALEDWVVRAAREVQLKTVVLAGGCFVNEILTGALTRRLTSRGFSVLAARQAPPNDGGLSLGQAWVAVEQRS